MKTMLPLESKGGGIGEGGGEGEAVQDLEWGGGWMGGLSGGAEAEFGGWREGFENQTADSTGGV